MLKIRKKEKKKKEKKKIETGKGSYLSAPNGYTFTPSFIKTGNRYGTILKVVNKYGMNRNYDFGWFVSMIPEINEDGVKGYYVEVDKPTSKREQDTLIKDNVSGSITSNENTMGSSQGDNSLKRLRIKDLKEADVLHSINNKIIDWKIHILLVSDSADAIERQIDKLKTLYDDNVLGVKLMSFGGDQEKLFENLLLPPEGDIYDYTSMSSVFAGNDHAIRKGLDDPDGYPIGSLSISYSSGEAFMALDRTFTKKIMIASHKESKIISYNDKLSAPSLWGQLIANNATVRGHRTFHIVLNGFKYYGERGRNSTFSCDPSINSIIKRVNLAKGGLNPLEVFGNKKDVINLYSKNLNKNVQILYLLSNRQLNGDTQGKLRKSLNDFYISQGLWDLQAGKHPERVRILGVEDHESFPTYGQFVNRLVNLQTKANRSGTEAEIDRINILQETLETSLNKYMSIFNEPTTLSTKLDPDIMQYYFDISDLRADPDIMEAQMLNVFDYTTNFAKKDDIIMIHGVDKISVETLQIIEQRIALLEDDGVRMAYLYDTIGGGDKNKNNEVEHSNVFNTDGILYEEFNEFDYTILGGMSNSDLEKYETKMKEPLTKQLAKYLTTDSKIQYQVRRPKDLVSNFINADFII